MTRDIATRLLDYLDRQAHMLEAAVEHWQPLIEQDGAFSDGDLGRIEELQLLHANTFEPLHAEYASLRNEWERDTPADEQRALVRVRASEVATLIDRVRAMEAELAERIQHQMRDIASSAQELRRGRKMTRDYGASRTDDARFVDRQA